MDHLDTLLGSDTQQPRQLLTKLTGRYYTPEPVCSELTRQVVGMLPVNKGNRIRVIDPFAGDGRMLESFVASFVQTGLSTPIHLEAWDRDSHDLLGFADRILARYPEQDIEIVVRETDTFRQAASCPDSFDVVITNPPWELLKPDPRELKGMPSPEREQYIEAMRGYARSLDQTYPDAKPAKKFGGWGTNLSRMGLDASLQLLNSSGILGIVMPGSLLADTQSHRLRRKLLQNFKLKNVCLYPAEAKLFSGVDIPCIALIAERGLGSVQYPLVTRYGSDISVLESSFVELPHEFLEQNDYIIPLNQGNSVVALMAALAAGHRPFAHYQEQYPDFWAGREVDETRISEKACDDPSALRFVRGRFIERFKSPKFDLFKIRSSFATESTRYERIAWRDVSRPSQKRRLIATLIPPGSIAGNSLSVACFRGDYAEETRLLLGVFSSYVFEFQLRAYLATNHVSLSAVRKVCVPSIDQLKRLPSLLAEVERLMREGVAGSHLLESIVAKQAYGLREAEFIQILRHFQHISEEELMEICATFNSIDHPAPQKARLVA